MKSITKKISKYNFSSRSGQKIKYIVMHFTGNKTDTALNNANYFGGGNRNASAHYFVDNDNIVQVVEETNASWHCGDGNGKYGITNQNSIGIEMCGTNGVIAKDTESNTIDLVKSLMKKYDIPIDRVVRHYDTSRKNCPSPWSANNWSKWSDFKKKLVTSNTPVKKPSKPVNKPVAKEVYRIRKSWEDADSQKGAYSVLSNAKEECDKHKGYFVFNSKGNIIYPKTESIEYTHRNIIVYNNGAEADKICAEYFAMILNSKNEDCVVMSYEEYKLGKKTARSLFAVGGSLEGKFKYDKLFSGETRYGTAYDVLQHLKSKY